MSATKGDIAARPVAAAEGLAPVRRFLHWSITLLVLGQVVLITVLRQLQSLEFGQVILGLHRQCGVLILVLAIVSLAVALRPGARAPVRSPAWQRTIAGVVHAAMMLLVIAQPVLGFLQASARGDQLTLFGRFTVPTLADLTTEQGQVFAALHRWSAYVLLALVAVHVGAVIFNHVVRKDSGMRRMLPGRPANTLVNRVPLAVQLAAVFGAILAMTTASGLYGAHEYVTIEALRAEFADTTLSPLDGLRQAQLDLKSLGPHADASPALRAETNAVAASLEQVGPLAAPDGRRALAAARTALADVDAPPGSAIATAERELQSAIDSQAAAAFERGVEIEQIGARGHDLIILTLAPTVLIAALLAILLARSILSAIAQARTAVRGAAQADHGGRVWVEGRGEFALLMGDILALRDAVIEREQAEAARQLRHRAEVEALDRRQMEAAAEARQEAAARREAETISQAKSEFLANMSHEIRTPLNGVLGMVQAMAHDPLSAKQRARLRVIKSSGESLLTLLNDFLDISKIEAGRMELENREFEPAEAVRAACAPFQLIAEGKGVAFDVTLDEAIGLCTGDVTRVRQVVSNLVSNALKFTERGRIAVTGARIGDDIEISVSDTGLGMAPETLDRMFDKFTQADASTTRRFGGTGLGLAICRDLANLMGGGIVATSALGEGSRFTLTIPLPRVEGAGAGARASAVSAEDITALRVLAAEDNAVNRLVLTTLLAQAGVSLTAVENGVEAVAAWAEAEWDVILMDVQMPVMDGLDATREIRQREAAEARARTPIIALTANVMTGQVAQYLELGMDGVVAKPINIEELFSAIELVLAQPEPPVAIGQAA